MAFCRRAEIGRPSLGVVSEAMDSEGRLSVRLDPILRELLSEHLAVRGSENPGRWELTDMVQRRLDQLEKVVPDPDKVVLFFGHACALCHQIRATRRLEGRHICAACAARS